MLSDLTSGLVKIRAKFMAALPTLLFFLFLFCTIIRLFGISYVILVSVLTVLFKINRQKYLTARQFLVLMGTQFLMTALGLYFCSL